MRGKFFRYSRWDALIVPAILVPVVMPVLMALYWQALGPLEWAVLGVLHVVLWGFSAYTGHNFDHTPFFTSRVLNQWGEHLLSVTMKVPRAGYKIGHSVHHACAMGYVDHDVREVLGLRPKTVLMTVVRGYVDCLSLGVLALALRYRFSAKARRELVAPRRRTEFHGYDDHMDYCAAVATHKILINPRKLDVAIFQALLATSFRVILVVISPGFFFLFYVPLNDIILSFVVRLQEYGMHVGGVSGDRTRDSVSTYGRLYNLLWVNIGYHQEHHHRPTLHWTKLPALREQMLPEAQRVTSTGTHCGFAVRSILGRKPVSTR